MALKLIAGAERSFMNKLGVIDLVAIVLVIIGGVNWGLVGAFQFDLVKTIFGDMTVLSRIVYSLVGLSALYVAIIVPTLTKKEE